MSASPLVLCAPLDAAGLARARSFRRVQETIKRSFLFWSSGNSGRAVADWRYLRPLADARHGCARNIRWRCCRGRMSFPFVHIQPNFRTVAVHPLIFSEAGRGVFGHSEHRRRPAPLQDAPRVSSPARRDAPQWRRNCAALFKETIKRSFILAKRISMSQDGDEIGAVRE